MMTLDCPGPTSLAVLIPDTPSSRNPRQMNRSETPDSVADSPRRLWLDWLVGLFLFAATATIVVWQNCRLGVLWDLSYVLENSYRISLGDIPYRDFPFPYPLLTFLVQASIVKVTGG